MPVWLQVLKNNCILVMRMASRCIWSVTDSPWSHPASPRKTNTSKKLHAFKEHLCKKKSCLISLGIIYENRIFLSLLLKSRFSTGVGVPGSIILFVCYGQVFFNEKWPIHTSVKGPVSWVSDLSSLSNQLCDLEQVT